MIQSVLLTAICVKTSAPASSHRNERSALRKNVASANQAGSPSIQSLWPALYARHRLRCISADPAKCEFPCATQLREARHERSSGYGRTCAGLLGLSSDPLTREACLCPADCQKPLLVGLRGYALRQYGQNMITP